MFVGCAILYIKGDMSVSCVAAQLPNDSKNRISIQSGAQDFKGFTSSFDSELLLARSTALKEGALLKIETLQGEPGAEISFDKVLLVADGDNVSVGTPTVSGAKVSGKILDQGKHPKQIIFKMRPKKRYRVKTGHRQKYTEVEITKISTK